MSLYILAIVGIVVVLYVVTVLFIYFRQSAYMYEPDRAVGATPREINIDYDDVRIKTKDGEIIAGWYVPAFEPEKSDDKILAGTTVLICHGNAGNLSDRLDLITVFHKLNMNIFIFDYRGFGDSTGKPSEVGTYNDALAAWNYLTGVKGVGAESVLVYGRSLGGAVAVWLAAEVKASALVLEATFTSVMDMAKQRFPIFPAKRFCRFRYPSIEVLAGIRCPVVVAHCKTDRIIPYKFGRRLFEVASKPKLFVELNASHARGMEVDIEYQRALRKFLISHFLHKGI